MKGDLDLRVRCVVKRLQTLRCHRTKFEILGCVTGLCILTFASGCTLTHLSGFGSEEICTSSIYASMLLHNNINAHVFIAVVAFIAGATLTICYCEFINYLDDHLESNDNNHHP